MRKLKEVLRLELLGLSQHQIARSCGISQSTVHEYVTAARAASVKWPLPENWDDGQIEQALFPNRPAPAGWRKHPEPDWPPIHEDLQTNKNLTLQLVWQERRENDPAGYAYSRFCDLYRQWLKRRDLVLRQDHRAGEKMFVDYAGATIPIHDPQSGAIEEASRVRRRARRQQLHLRRSHHRTRLAQLDRFAYPGVRVFRRRGGSRGAG